MPVTVKTSADTWRRYVESDRPVGIRNKIVMENEKLACKVVRQIAFKYIEEWEADDKLPELISLGMRGLIKAVERFNPAEGNAFSSFAVPYIRGEVQHYQRDKGDLVRMPRQSREIVNTISRIVRQRELAGLPTTPEQVAHNTLRLSPLQWQQIQEEAKRRPLLDVDELQVAASEPNYPAEWLGEVNRLCAYLSPRKQAIIHSYFYQNKSVGAIAKEQGIPVEMVEDQLSEALAKLRELLKRSAIAPENEFAITEC